MNVLSLLLIIFALAFLVETLVEFLFSDLIKSILPKVQPQLPMKFIAVASAIGLAFFYQFDFIYLLAQFLETDWQPLQTVSVPGMIITGAAIGKGSNYVHDFIQKFFVKKE